MLFRHLEQLEKLRSKFEISTEDVILQCSKITFDPSIVEIFLALMCGSTLIIISDDIRSIPRKLIDVIMDCNVTVLQGTPSVIESFGNDLLRNFLLNTNSCLRVMALGGEVCPSESKLSRWRADGNKTQLYNLYGLTEISCWATCFRIDFENRNFSSNIPLGKPLTDTIIEIKDKDGNIADEGELFIGGSKRWCIINDETCPASDTVIMRPTGDIAYKTSDGNIYFEGRNDNVIKYKGHKLSLQCVNNAIQCLPEISSHFIHFDHTYNRLNLFAVLNAQNSNSHDATRHLLMQKLRNCFPNLPATEIIFVPFIPLTPHGKCNYKKLLDVVTIKSKKRDITESIYEDYFVDFISDLWKNYTNQKIITETDNFILKGGDSMLAVQFASDVEWKYQASIPLLVEKLLNGSFADICTVVKSCILVFDMQCLGTESPLSSLKTVSCEPLSKKIHHDNHRCFKMACKRGYFFTCAHSSDSEVNFCKRKAGSVVCDSELFLKLKYKCDLKKCVDASACVAYFYRSNQLLAFIGSHYGLFVCIDVHNECISWAVTLPDRIESSACMSACGNYTVVGCYDHSLYCFDITSGNIKWRFKVGAEIKSSPAVSNNNIAFVGAHDKYLYAVEIESGNLLWKKIISNGSIFSSPAVSELLHAVCTATLDGVVSLLKMNSGDILWMYNYGKPIFSSPLITSTSVFVGSTDGYLLHFDFAGNLIFKYQTSGPIFSSAALTSGKDENIVFGCHDCYVYCIDQEGKCLWKILCDSSVYATPFTFQWRQEHYLTVACTSGTLYIIQQRDGKMVQCWKCPGELFSSPVVLNTTLIIGCRDNNVYCFNL